MQIVIDISEDDYIKVQDGRASVSTMRKAIKNGTPLDKIRKQIELEKLGYPPSAGYFKAITKVLQIIDRHMAESEDEDANSD